MASGWLRPRSTMRRLGCCNSNFLSISATFSRRLQLLHRLISPVTEEAIEFVAKIAIRSTSMGSLFQSRYVFVSKNVTRH
jgi:hypothetical protein